MLTGEKVKKIIRSMNISMQEVSETLEMSRQNLNNHLRKAIVSDGFFRLLKEKYPRYFTNDKELNQSNNIHSQKQQPNSNMQDYKDVAMKSMAQRIEELENKTINLTVRLSKYESIEEVKPKSREAS